MEEIGEFW